jgi:predicted SprT family Zn-dependent metalloprotease
MYGRACLFFEETVFPYIYFLSHSRSFFTMVYFYKCKKCEMKFVAPMNIQDEKGSVTYVCPNCKSRNWGPLGW